MTKTLKLMVALGAAVVLPLGAYAGEGQCDAKAAGTCTAGKEAACAEKAGTCPASQAAAAAQTAGLIQVVYVVDGMTCEACENKLAKALLNVDGVKQASACSKSKQAKLAYDGKKVKEADLLAAIGKTGFKTQAEIIDVKVEGMTCGGCSSKVGNALASVKGVKEQKVCHEAKNAVVTFDPNTVSRAQIIAAISQTGFQVAQ